MNYFLIINLPCACVECVVESVLLLARSILENFAMPVIFVRINQYNHFLIKYFNNFKLRKVLFLRRKRPASHSNLFAIKK